MEFRLLDKKSPEKLLEWLKNEVMQGVDSNTWISKTRINSSITDYANWGMYNNSNNPLTGDAKWIPFQKLDNRPQCLIPMLACIVLSNGNVSFCPCDNFDDVEELRLGNIMEHSLASLYNSPRAQELWQWKKYGTPAFCKNCSFHIPLSLLQETPSILTDPHQIVGAG
jgi:radical SAM protein with 4Fe4S-binding SPASM domain